MDAVVEPVDARHADRRAAGVSVARRVRGVAAWQARVVKYGESARGDGPSMVERACRLTRDAETHVCRGVYE